MYIYSYYKGRPKYIKLSSLVFWMEYLQNGKFLHLLDYLARTSIEETSNNSKETAYLFFDRYISHKNLILKRSLYLLRTLMFFVLTYHCKYVSNTVKRSMFGKVNMLLYAINSFINSTIFYISILISFCKQSTFQNYWSFT